MSREKQLEDALQRAHRRIDELEEALCEALLRLPGEERNAVLQAAAKEYEGAGATHERGHLPRAPVSREQARLDAANRARKRRAREEQLVKAAYREDTLRYLQRTLLLQLAGAVASGAISVWLCFTAEATPFAIAVGVVTGCAALLLLVCASAWAGAVRHLRACLRGQPSSPTRPFPR